MKTLKLITLISLTTMIFSCQKEELFFEPADTLQPDKAITGRASLFPSITLDFNLESSNSNMGGFAGQSMTLFKGYLWLVGGDNGNTPPWTSSSEVWRSPNGKDWKLVTSNLFDERTNHSLLVFKNKMWLIGGINAAGEVLSDIWNTTDGIHWKQVKSLNPLLEIGQNSSVVFNNRIYVFRGNGRVNEEVWSSSDGSNWRMETDNAFPARSHYKTIVFNGFIYVFGGWLSGGDLTNEVWASPDGRYWYQKRPADAIFEARINHTATAFDGKVWVMGGESWDDAGTRTFHGDIWYSTNMKYWSKYDKKPPFYKGLHSHEGLVYKDKLWVFGGYRPDGSMASSITDNAYSAQ
jgi:N-acetylneuraminic acid mutarotase